jgi:sugar lactone lactonase YvrE
VSDGTNLFVADSGNHTIRKVVIATGAVTTLAGTAGTSGSTDGTGAAARFNVPIGLTIDNAGNLYVSDQNYTKIRKIVTSTGVVTTISATF